jgi:hypothetical protein
VSFGALIGGARPPAGHTLFYEKMAEINRRIRVMKVALDADDDLLFMYELPNLNKESFRQMCERFESYVMRHAIELMRI